MLSLFRAHCSSVAPRTVTRGLQTSARLAYPKGPNASNLDEEKQNEATTQDQDKKTMPGMSSDQQRTPPTDTSRKPGDSGMPGSPDSPRAKKSDSQKRNMSALARDADALAKMKERMGDEGDELWEDDRPPTSGLRKNVGANMFRVI